MCIYKIRDINVQKAFVIIVPIIFVLFFICMPTFKNHDEDAHWIRAYDIAQGNFITSTEYGHIFAENSTNYPATKLPKAILQITDVQYKQNHTAKDLLNIKVNDDDELYVAMPTTAIYSPIQYLPQAIGIYLADLITDRPIIMAYVARIFNMIFCYVILYYAIKLMPFGKELLLIAMSIPIAIEGFTSMSPDGMTISMSLLLIAYVLRLVYSKEIMKIAWKQKVILATISIVLALCKIVYLPLVGLVLLLPKEKFYSRKDQILTIGGIMLLAIVANLRMACSI